MDYARYGLSDYDRRSSERATVHSVKLQSSLSRSRRIILEYGLCNDWDWFVTLTLDPLKYDRENLMKFRKDFGQFIQDYNKRKMPVGFKITYVLVPEFHSDRKSWHMHGLMHGLPADHLSDFVEGLHPHKLCTSGFKNWRAYEKKFGFMSLGSIRDKTAAAFYMTKYITKDLISASVDLNNRVVFASHGLQKPKYVLKNELVEFDDGFCFDYENEYCRLKTFRFLGDMFNVSDNFMPFSDTVSGELLTWEQVDNMTDEWIDTFEDCENAIFDEYENVKYTIGKQVEMEF